MPRDPFRPKARSPRVRTPPFTARPPNLRQRPLAMRASRFLARSPWPPPPCIRFLSVGPRLRSTLLSHGRSPFRSCASLRSLWPTLGRTCTSKVVPMPGTQKPREDSLPAGSSFQCMNAVTAICAIPRRYPDRAWSWRPSRSRRCWRRSRSCRGCRKSWRHRRPAGGWPS